MKRLLQNTSSLVVVFALITAAMWLVWSVSGRQGLTAQATPTQSQPVQWKTVTATTALTSSDNVSPTTTVGPQAITEPTVTATLDFDALKVVSVEEITPVRGQAVGKLADGKSVPVGLAVDWSPDQQKALVARQLTEPHVLSRSSEAAYAPLAAMDLWVWDQKTEQEIKVTNNASYWNWSPDSQAIVYLIPVEAEGLEGELHIFDLNTKIDRKIVETDLTQAYPGPFWLSSGDIIYMDEARLWIMQPDGNNRRLLNDLQIYRAEAVDAGRTEYSYGPDKLGGRLYISPDETRIAYTTLSSVEPNLIYQLWVADLSGDNLIKMEEQAAFREWSSDGSFFLYQIPVPGGDSLFNDLWLASRDGLNRQQVLDATEWGLSLDYTQADVKERPGLLGYVALSPHDDMVVFSEFSEGGIWLLDLGSARWRLLYQDENLRSLTSLTWVTNDNLIVSTSSGTMGALEHKYFRLLLDTQQ